MREFVRQTLVGCLIATLTVGPSFACHQGDCGCHDCYPAPAVDCWDCGSPCSQADCTVGCSELVYIEDDPCGCGGTTLVHDPESAPVEAAQPAPAQEMPDRSEVVPPPTITDPQPKPAEKMAEEPTTVELPPEPTKEIPETIPEVEVPEPAVEEDLESLFDAPQESEPEAETPPMEEPAEETETDSLDDLFSEPPPETDEEPPAEDMPEEPAESEESDDLLDDLFGEVGLPAELVAPGGLRSRTHRTWTDNTAKYQCQARLLGVAQGEIVLAKADGKIKRVPMRRLSDADLRFAYGQVVAERELLARLGATKKLASTWSQ